MGTDIREVPSSVEFLKGLKDLWMSGCKKLSITSTNICKLKSLESINLRTNLESFPEIMEPMESLKWLNLNCCTRLKRLPNDHNFHNFKSLEHLYLSYTAITELPSSIQHLICLQTLDIYGCQNLTSLPSFIHNLRMKYLDLSGCKRLHSLPADMKQLSQLLRLVVTGCSNLCSLPELPSSLEILNANGCVSLKTVPSACFFSESRTKVLKFANCFKWDEEECRRVLDIVFSKYHYSLNRQVIPNPYAAIEMILPWSTEIPQWFCGSQSVGSSLTLKLPMDDQCYRLAFCVVIKPNYANSIDPEDSYSFNRMECYVDDDGYGLLVTSDEFGHLSSDIDHLLGCYYGATLGILS